MIGRGWQRCVEKSPGTGERCTKRHDHGGPHAINENGPWFRTDKPCGEVMPQPFDGPDVYCERPTDHKGAHATTEFLFASNNLASVAKRCKAESPRSSGGHRYQCMLEEGHPIYHAAAIAKSRTGEMITWPVAPATTPPETNSPSVELRTAVRDAMVSAVREAMAPVLSELELLSGRVRALQPGPQPTVRESTPQHPVNTDPTIILMGGQIAGLQGEVKDLLDELKEERKRRVDGFDLANLMLRLASLKEADMGESLQKPEGMLAYLRHTIDVAVNAWKDGQDPWKAAGEPRDGLGAPGTREMKPEAP